MPKTLKGTKWSPIAKSRRVAIADSLDTDLAHPSQVHRLVARSTFIRAFIEPERLGSERKLSETCFVAYAYMLPLERTQLFLTEYLAVYRRWWEKVHDCNEAPHQCPMSERLAENDQRDLNALWGARQVADALGIPYGTYINQAFEAMASHVDRQQFPRPNQLQGGWWQETVIAYWDEHLPIQHWNVEDMHPKFHAASFRAEPAQLRLHEIMEARINRRPERLANYLCKENHIFPEQVARERFGDDLVDQALKSVGSSPRVEVCSEPKHLPMCLGLTYDSSPDCAGCPFAAQCRQVWDKATLKLVSDHGSIDPRQAHKRQLARDRKRRSREKLRVGQVAG